MFDDLLSPEDFLIDPEDEVTEGENWDTGVPSDVFKTGANPDIFSTKDAVVVLIEDTEV